jgi:hypothetical protein
MKTALSGGLIFTIGVTALIHASPAAATPDTPTTDTACGTTLESWMPYPLEGVQWHNQVPIWSKTRIQIGTDSRAYWRMETETSVRETKGHDRVWIESNSARFKSDLGVGRGDMWDFTLWGPACNEEGHVVSAHATTHIPNGIGGVNTWKNRPAEPLKPA